MQFKGFVVEYCVLKALPSLDAHVKQSSKDKEKDVPNFSLKVLTFMVELRHIHSIISSHCKVE